MIKISSLAKTYEGNIILEDISLTFNNGEIHGLVGENGAGKTTLFKCLSGLEDYEGKIEYGGGVLKNKMGYLPTIPYFLSRMTGYEYLILLCNARGIHWKNIRSHNVFELPLDKYAETYSTGMQKKLAITALLLQKNEVFVLDEPFNGVDISSNILIREILIQLKALDKIIIMSSHIFSTLHDTCDYVHYLKDHKIKYSLTKGNFDIIEMEMKTEGSGADIVNTIYSV